jgi:hypothetical protein
VITIPPEAFDVLIISSRSMAARQCTTYAESARRGETNPAALAALADRRLRATEQQLCDALGASQELNAVYRRVVKMALEELQLIEQQMDQLDHEIPELLSPHQDGV